MFEYDVAISFAGEQRAEAEAIAECLRNSGIKVFYDLYEQANLWGKDLYEHLSDIYQNKARYCLMLVSAAYADKAWATPGAQERTSPSSITESRIHSSRSVRRNGNPWSTEHGRPFAL